MRKDIKCIILSGTLYMAGILCAGCTGSSGGKADSVQETTKSVVESLEEAGEVPQGKRILTDVTEFKAPRQEQSYQFETDYQFYMTPTFGSAKTEQGYCFSDSAFLYLFDPETGIYDYLCGKPECTHQDNTCNAYAPNFLEVEYYNGYLYMACESILVEPEDENVTKYDVIKVALDGSTKDKVAEVAKVIKNKDTDELKAPYITYIQHRGYLYYIYNIGTGNDESSFYNNGSNCLYRVPLEGSREEECILPLDYKTNISIMHMTAEGSYVYFVMSDTNGFGKLYRYNTESDVVEEMGIGEIAAETYTVLNGRIIYKKKYDDKILYSYHPMDGTETVFSDMTGLDDGDSWDVMRDNSYVYVYYTNKDSGEAYFLFLDSEGNYVGKAVVSQEYEEGSYAGDVLGGDEYMMYRPIKTGKFMYLKKADIADGTVYLKEAEQPERN